MIFRKVINTQYKKGIMTDFSMDLPGQACPEPVPNASYLWGMSTLSWQNAASCNIVNMNMEVQAETNTVLINDTKSMQNQRFRSQRIM